MSTGRFPDDAWRRKAILILDKHDIERCEYEEDNSTSKALYDDETHVLEFPPESAHPIVQNLLDGNLLRPGVILVQSPFDRDVYEDASLAASRFALTKQMIFSTFCNHLGAREVIVDQIEIQSSNGKMTLDIKAKRFESEASVKVDREALDSFSSQMTLHDTFDGGKANPDAAEDLLRRSGLLGDPNMMSLLEMKRMNMNPLKERQLTLNLSSETRRNMSVVGRLKVAAFIKLQADYVSVVNEQSDYKLTLRVVF